MDFISLVNLYCQKNKLATPIYKFFPEEQGFVCYVDSFIGSEWSSNNYKSKQEAKNDIAKHIYNALIKEGPAKQTQGVSPTLCVSIKGSPTIDPKYAFFIDGDQRSDVVKWLGSLKDFNNEVHIFVSPVTSLQHTGKFMMHTSKSTGKDSFDADLLMFLGKEMYNNDYGFEYVIVSGDHILVQAAIDHGLKFAKNLQDLQNLL